jgi:hypothetical protein
MTGPTRTPGAVRAAVLAVALALAAPAHAQDDLDEEVSPDYETGSAAWNGLSTLEALARGMGLEVIQERSMDWDDLKQEDVLFLLYPTTRLDPGHLAAFLHNGGRVLVADDFGRSEEALAGLGILRGTGIGVRADQFYEGHSYAPVARPLIAAHPLAAGVSALTANHPSVWNATRGADAVFGFEGGDSLVATVEVDEGRLVALADPSVLINRMLEFDGNLTFAINLLRYLSRPGESGRLVILNGDLSLLGEPSRVLGESGSTGVTGLLGDFNRWLIGLNEYLLTETGLRVLAVAIALLVAGFAIIWLPRARQAALDGSWTRARGGASDLPNAEQVLAEVDRPGRRSFTLPAAILRDSINARLALLLGQPEPLSGMSEMDLRAALIDRGAHGAAQILDQLYPALRALPSRAQAVSPWEAPFMTQRDFERLSAAADRLYRSLEGEG